MNKKNIVIASVAVLFVAVLIAVGNKNSLQRLKNSGDQNDFKKSANQETLQSIEDMDKIMREAVSTGDKTKCDQLTTSITKENCLAVLLTGQATEAKDVKICGQIKPDIQRTVCKDQVVFVIAKDDKNPELCDTLIQEIRIKPCKEAAQP